MDGKGDEEENEDDGELGEEGRGNETPLLLAARNGSLVKLGSGLGIALGHGSEFELGLGLRLRTLKSMMRTPLDHLKYGVRILTVFNGPLQCVTDPFKYSADPYIV